MQMHDCNSSQIKQYGYDPETRVMAVAYKRTPGIYNYKDVPEAVFTAFLESDSKGSFLHHHIKGQYDWDKS